MKKIALILGLFLSVGLFAQNEVTTYFENGNIKMELTKVGDRSMQTIYYETGEIKQVGIFVNNLPSGVWKTYTLNGDLLSEGLYSEGKKTGKWIVNAFNTSTKYALLYEDGIRVDAIALK